MRVRKLAVRRGIGGLRFAHQARMLLLALVQLAAEVPAIAAGHGRVNDAGGGHGRVYLRSVLFDLVKALQPFRDDVEHGPQFCPVWDWTGGRAKGQHRAPGNPIHRDFNAAPRASVHVRKISQNHGL